MYPKLSSTLSRWLAPGFALCAFAFALSSLATQSVMAQSQSQDRLAAQRKFHEAEALRAQGIEKSLRTALTKFQESLPLWRSVNDRAKEVKTLTSIGDIYNALSEYQKALDYLNQALPISRAAGDRRGEAETLKSIGYVYNSLTENQKALNSLNQTIPISCGEAQTLDWLSVDL